MQTGPRTHKVRGLFVFLARGFLESGQHLKEVHVSKDQSKQVREEVSNGAVDQCIAELAELVAERCGRPVTSSYVREEFQALVEEIRARAVAMDAPRQSTTRLKTVSGPAGEGAFEFRSDPPPAPEAHESRAVAASGTSRVVSLDDARRVFDALRSEESSGDGPREDLQRAIA